MSGITMTPTRGGGLRVSATKIKPKLCAKCGCERVFTTTAKVTVNSGGGSSMTYTFKRLCVPCLLDAMNMKAPGTKGKYDHEKAMACVPEKA